MKYRKLRIAWSVTWGMVAVLLVVLWVRSYWWEDVATDSFSQAMDIGTQATGDNHGVGLASSRGIISGEILDFTSSGTKLPLGSFSFSSRPATGKLVPSIMRGQGSILGFQWRFLQHGSTVYVPYWFPVVVTVAIAVVPWVFRITYRFSLRALLIATTLVAVGLGVVVWLR